MDQRGIPIEVVCVQDQHVLFECATHDEAQRNCADINEAERAHGSPTRVYARPKAQVEAS